MLGLSCAVKLITLCLWRRPNYTRQVLDALSRCVGISDYTILAHLDGPPDGQLSNICGQFTACPLLLMQSAQHIGGNASTRRVLNMAFQMADYVIHDEDDVVFAPDALRYFEWARQFEHDASLLTIAAWYPEESWVREHGDPAPHATERHRKVVFLPNFHAWGWATWRSRWSGIREHWTTGTDHTRSWDVALCAYRNATGRGQLIPLVSRTNNIGAELGTHRGDCLLSEWAGSPGFPTEIAYERV